MQRGRKLNPVVTEIAATLGISRHSAAQKGKAFHQQFQQMSDDAKLILANSSNRKPVRSAPAITDERKAQK